jgi:hypothetical protein
LFFRAAFHNFNVAFSHICPPLLHPQLRTWAFGLRVMLPASVGSTCCLPSGTPPPPSQESLVSRKQPRGDIRETGTDSRRSCCITCSLLPLREQGSSQSTRQPRIHRHRHLSLQIARSHWLVPVSRDWLSAFSYMYTCYLLGHTAWAASACPLGSGSLCEYAASQTRASLILHMHTLLRTYSCTRMFCSGNVRVLRKGVRGYRSAP